MRIASAIIAILLLLLGSSISYGQTPDVIGQAQQKLKELGYYTGSIDRGLGPQTRDAIAKFQKDKNLPQTGNLDGQTQQSLGIQEQKPEAQPPTGNQTNNNTQNPPINLTLDIPYGTLYVLFIILAFSPLISVLIAFLIYYLMHRIYLRDLMKDIETIKKSLPLSPVEPTWIKSVDKFTISLDKLSERFTTSLDRLSERLATPISIPISIPKEITISLISPQTHEEPPKQGNPSTTNEAIIPTQPPETIGSAPNSNGPYLNSSEEIPGAATKTTVESPTPQAQPLPRTDFYQNHPATVFYNSVLNNYRRRDEFMREFKALQVSPQDSPELNQGALTPDDYKPRFDFDQVGRLFVIEIDSEKCFLFPSFDPLDLSPAITTNFVTTRAVQAKHQQKLQMVKEPAICKRIGDRKWELIQKGEIEIL